MAPNVVDVQETLPHGSTVVRQGHRVVSVHTRDGTAVANLTWDGDRLVRADLTLPDQGTIALVTGGGEHPIFGPVDRLVRGTASLAFFGRIDWLSPTHVPPLDRPGALPSGAGAAVLNLLAIVARSADVEALRYRGPYPTAALFDSLLCSFVVDGDLDSALTRFTADVERTAVLGRMHEADVDFAPAPFEWSWPHPRVCVQRRDGIERIYVDGHAFDAWRRGPRRVLLEKDGSAKAVVAIGDTPWATVVALDAEGALVGEPEPLPKAPADLVGQPLPTEVTAVLGEAVAERAVASLRNAIREVLGSVALVWGDPGLSVVRATDRGIEIHAGMVASLPTESSKLLEALLMLVEPVALRLAQARLAEAHDALLRR